MFIKGAILGATTTFMIIIGSYVGLIPTITGPTTKVSTIANTNVTSDEKIVPTEEIVASQIILTSSTETVKPLAVSHTTKKRKPDAGVPDRQMRSQNIAYLRDQYRLSQKEPISRVNDVVLQLATNAFFECRGEGVECMAAVTHVVINRLKDDRFPQTVKGVLIAPGQYSWTPDQARITRSLTAFEKKEVWAAAVDTVYAVLQGEIVDHTNGSLYFCNPKVSTVKFCRSLNRHKRAKIGNHVFG